MRDPDRLDSLYEELLNIHKNVFPDWRFGQLMINFLNWVYENKKIDPFFPEENKMLEYLKEFSEQ